MLPGETMMREALAAWEKAASKMATETVRDPRTLELGAEWLRTSLMWKRAHDQLAARFVEHGLATLRTMTGGAK
jgi:hypothetical protein